MAEAAVPEVSLSTGSEAVFDIECAPCGEEGQHKEAESYCRDCGENLCRDCVRDHKKVPSLKRHKLMDTDAMTGTQGNPQVWDTCTEKCPDHKSEIIKFFCPDHRVTACVACKCLNHKLCEDLEYIEEAASGLEDRQDYKEFTASLDDLTQQSEDTVTQALESKQRSSDCHAKIVQDLEAYEEELVSTVQRHMEAIRDQAGQIHAQDEVKMDKLASQGNKMLTELRAVVTNVNDLKAKKHFCKLFVEMKQREQMFRGLRGNLERMGVEKVSAYSFQPGEDLRALIGRQDDIGKLVITGTERSSSTASGNSGQPPSRPTSSTPDANTNASEHQVFTAIEAMSDGGVKMGLPRDLAIKLAAQTMLYCKFDDDVVSKCTKQEALDRNFGGHDDDISVKHCTNAYMLAYIRESCKDDILCSVTEKDIPDSLKDRLAEERRLEAQKRQERKEAHLYMNVQVVTEDYFYGHQGTDLFDLEKANFRNFKVKKTATLKDFMDMLSENLKYPVNQLRPWPFQARQNQTYRPTLLDLEADLYKPVQELADESTWSVYVETQSPESNLQRLPHFDKDCDVLLFLKMYDPRTKSISYCGHAYVPISAKGSELIPELNKRAGFPAETQLILFEEVKPNLLEMLPSTDLPMEKMLEELMDGDIIVFQRDEQDLDQYELPTAKDYFRDLYYRVEITFCDKNLINDPGFTLELSQRINYDQMANSVARYLSTDPYLLQFFKPQGYREGPGNPIRCTFEGTLKELLLYTKPRQQRRLYYQQLNIRINEMENKRQFKCIYVNSKLKEENQQRELTVRHAKETDREMKRRLDVQKDEYEETIKRHLSFIDQLIDDKKQLSEKCESLVKELKQVDKKYQDRIKAIVDKHSLEMQRLKDMHEAAEKLRREKWIDEKTKKIKEMTVKGLEPEIQRLIAKHKSEIKKIKQIQEAELLESDERAAQKYVRMTEELRDQLADEKESACARERELAKQRYEKQVQQEEEAYQQQRRRMLAEVQEEKDRLAGQASRQRLELDKLQQQLQEKHTYALDAMKTEFDKARAEQEKRHETETRELKERVEIEKQTWEENYRKKQENYLMSKERQLKDGVKKERNKEIELVIRQLEQDATTARQDCERVAENRIKRMREKYEMEMKGMEGSERQAMERYNEMKARLTEVEGDSECVKVQLKQKDQEIKDLQKLTDKMHKERDRVSDIVRQEFADRLVFTEEENRRVKTELSELRARQRLELERAKEDMEQVKRSKDEEMEEVHKRVKSAIVKKEEVVNQLKQQYQAALKRADHLEGLLQQQRKQLLGK